MVDTSILEFGAQEGIRTLMSLRPTDFKSLRNSQSSQVDTPNRLPEIPQLGDGLPRLFGALVDGIQFSKEHCQ